MAFMLCALVQYAERGALAQTAAPLHAAARKQMQSAPSPPTSPYPAQPRIGSIPFELSENHIFVRARLNNSQQFWFILDSGASLSVLNSARVEALGLQPSGVSRVSAVGGVVEGGMVMGITLVLSGIRIENQAFASLPLGVVEPEAGRAVDGVLGGDFFSRFVVEIDYAARVINLYDPQSYRYTRSGEIIPVRLDDTTPLARASITRASDEIITGEFLIDTGAGRSLNFTSAFVTAHQLLNPPQRTIRGFTGAALGGETVQRIGRVRRLQLGRFAIADAIASFSQDADGEQARADYAGSIGGDILSRFTVIFDYSRGRIIIEPNSRFTERDEHDMSGMSLVAEGADFRAFRVTEVSENSPAFDAGVRVGDMLLNIDSQPAANFTLDRLQHLLRRHGRWYVLQLRRGREVIRARIRLRRLV